MNKQDEYHRVNFRFGKARQEWEKTRDPKKWEEVQKLQKQKNKLRDELAVQVVLDDSL